ncbi:MAG TPA: hypothetical protein VGQ00_02885 [Candidatus Norongarragalinales archaeon]|jgi:hypothetical protein|nr:hypothetical protein [Candidatus Norongarragalinales archaeon]
MVERSEFANSIKLRKYLEKRYLDKKTNNVILPPRSQLPRNILDAIDKHHGGLNFVRKNWFKQAPPMQKTLLAEWPNFRLAIDPHLVRDESGNVLGMPPERWMKKRKLGPIIHAIKEHWQGHRGVSEKLRLPVIPQKSEAFKSWVKKRAERYEIARRTS